MEDPPPSTCLRHKIIGYIMHLPSLPNAYLRAIAENKAEIHWYQIIESILNTNLFFCNSGQTVFYQRKYAPCEIGDGNETGTSVYKNSTKSLVTSTALFFGVPYLEPVCDSKMLLIRKYQHIMRKSTDSEHTAIVRALRSPNHASNMNTRKWNRFSHSLARVCPLAIDLS